MADNQGVAPAPGRPFNVPEYAQATVYEVVKQQLEKLGRHGTFSADEVFVVWFCYILGGWKALLSTTLPDGMYYEVTFNKDKQEIYVDHYVKTEQTLISVV